MKKFEAGEDIENTAYKLAELMGDVLRLIKKVDGEYLSMKSAGDAATSLLQKKGRALRNAEVSGRSSRDIFKFVESMAETKTFNVNQHMMIKKIQQARDLVDR